MSAQCGQFVELSLQLVSIDLNRDWPTSRHAEIETMSTKFVHVEKSDVACPSQTFISFSVYNPRTVPTMPELAAEVGQIRDLSRSGRHSEALAASERLTREVPGNREAIYLVAANQRCLHRVTEALATLQQLEQRHPQFSLLYQERGYCYTMLRDAPRAVESFSQAIELDPALVASWTMLDRLYRMTGETKGAAIAAEHVRILQQFRQSNPLEDTERRLENALKLTPNDRAGRLAYIRILLDQQEYLHADEVIDEIGQPDFVDTYLLSLHAAACVGLGRHEQAIEIYRRLLATSWESAEMHVALGHSLQSLGRRKEAIESYRKAAAIRPSFGDAYWSLANLKTYSFSQDEIAQMHAEEVSSTVAATDRCHLCFALGKAYEERKEYERSWQFYERGNELKHAESQYNSQVVEANTRKQVEVCTAEFFAARAGVGTAAAGPIFIVGLPRSGSTLVEQILASHSQVEATQELAEIRRIVRTLERGSDLDNPGYPEALAAVAPGDFRMLGERYVKSTRAYRGDKPFFIDKMPNNFRHLGLIHLMLPNAKLIDVRREPMACCFSNFKQLFASGQEFTYSIGDLALYYKTYLELMRHWDEVLPGRILQMQYEDLVGNLEPNVVRLLRFCGLEFEPGCVEFHKLERAIATASSEQVRQPVFRDGLFQWRNYEPWLGPLRDGLGAALLHYRE